MSRVALDAYEAIATKLDVREFAQKHVPGETKTKILEAARLTGSSMNTQHWRFILVQDSSNIARLASGSTTGAWIAKADFAIIILTDPKVPGYKIDAGRVLQDMELAAWDFGVASRLFTGFRQDEIRRDFAIPQELEISAALGFGYPVRRIRGRKNRKPLEELVFAERYGIRFAPAGVA